MLMGEIWRGSIPCSDNDTEALEGLFSVWGEVALKGEGETFPSFGKFMSAVHRYFFNGQCQLLIFPLSTGTYDPSGS